MTEKILQLRREGKTLREIGKECFMSHEAVRQVLIEEGYQSPAIKNMPWSVEEVELLKTAIKYKKRYDGLIGKLKKKRTNLAIRVKATELRKNENGNSSSL